MKTSTTYPIRLWAPVLSGLLLILFSNTAMGESCKFDREIDLTLDLSGSDKLSILAGAGALEVTGDSGTDLAVILSMCNYIVNEAGIYDVPFLKKYTNGPYLVKEDKLFVRDPETNEPMLWDQSDNKAKTWNDPTLSENVALEGEFEVNGVKCRPAFALIKENLKQYNPEWAEKVSTVPAATIRRISQEGREIIDKCECFLVIRIPFSTCPFISRA